MSCERTRDLFSAFLENDLATDLRFECQAHLDACPDCRALLAVMRETQDALAGFPELEVDEGLLAKLSGIPEKKKKIRFSLDFLLNPSLQPVYAAATVVLIAISFYAFGPAPKRNAINKAVSRQIDIGRGKIEKLYAQAGSISDELGGYKDNVLESLKTIKVFKKSEE